MLKPIDVKALTNYQLWVKYNDGIEGIIDLSNYVGKGVFSIWNDYACFEKVHIGSSGEIAWNDDIDLCPDSIYMKITGKTPEEIFPGLRKEMLNA